MKIKRVGLLVGIVALFSTFLIAPSSFADNNYYSGMDYAGGEPLSAENVTVNAELVSGLTSLVKMSDREVEYKYSTSDKWEDGYVKSGSNCKSVKFFRARKGDQINSDDNLSFKVSKNQYTVEVEFNDVFIDNDITEALAVGIMPYNGYIFYGQVIYTDTECTSLDVDIVGAGNPSGKDAFLKLKVRLFAGEEEVVSDGLYFGITDIDAAQSYRILNEGNQLSKNNMFVEDANSLQSDTSDFKNMFVESEEGNYIYSQYDDTYLNITNGKNNIFVRLNRETQEEGLELVWGFKGLAWSGVEYYAKQYRVEYESEENGEITGIIGEDVMSGGNPSGSDATPKEDYELDYWKANRDVTLEGGVVIKAGEKITVEQIKHVVVDQDITFIAVYKEVSPIEVPDTGVYTGEEFDAVAVSALMAVLLVGGMIVVLMSKVFHKRVSFDK